MAICGGSRHQNGETVQGNREENLSILTSNNNLINLQSSILLEFEEFLIRADGQGDGILVVCNSGGGGYRVPDSTDT